MMTAIGDQVLRDLMIGEGAASGGFGADFLINAASELAKRGVDTYQSNEDANKSKATQSAQLNKVIAADANWANAESLLDIANQSRDPARIAPAQTLQQSAFSAAMSAGAGLNMDGMQKRVQTAQDATNTAAQAAVGAPTDALKQAKMRAWQKVLAGTQSGAALGMPGAGMPGAHGAFKSSGNFLTKMHGPLPLYGWGIVTIVVIAGVVVVVKALRK